MQTRKSKNWIGKGKHPDLEQFRKEMFQLHQIRMKPPQNGQVKFYTNRQVEEDTMRECAEDNNVWIQPADAGSGGNMTPKARKALRDATLKMKKYNRWKKKKDD